MTPLSIEDEIARVIEGLSEKVLLGLTPKDIKSATAEIVSLLPAARAGEDVVEIKKQNEQLRDALEQADLAINPPDRDGISLHVWNERLKEITALIHKVLRQ